MRAQKASETGQSFLRSLRASEAASGARVVACEVACEVACSVKEGAVVVPSETPRALFDPFRDSSLPFFLFIKIYENDPYFKSIKRQR